MQIRRREQEVWQACDDLWALSGSLSDLTGDAIRERLLFLGKSKGSPNEIYKYRKSWEENRQIQRGQSTTEISDPISRAVKLVHEQLLSESQAKIASIEQDFLVQQKAYEEELQKAKNDFSNLLSEYELVHEKSLKQQDKIDNLQLEKQAFLQKIESLEQKNLQDKMLYEQHILLLQNSVLENKSTYEKEIEKITNIYEQTNKEAQNTISQLNNTQIKLGQEYSESLIEIKTELYNTKISLQKEIEQNELHYKKNLVLTKDLQTQQEKLAIIEKNIFANSQLNSQANKHLQEVLKQNKELKQQITKLLNERQASSACISKLRAMLK